MLLGYPLGYSLGWQMGYQLGYHLRFQSQNFFACRAPARRRTRRVSRPVLASAASAADPALYLDLRSAALAVTSSSPSTSRISAANLRKAKLAADSAFVSTTAWSVAV